MLPDLRAEGDFLTSGGGFADIFSADLAGYAVPTQLHPLLGGVIRAWSHDSTPQPDGSYFAVNKGQQIYLGYVALALAVFGAWRGRRRGETWFWVTSALLFFVLTLGPNLRIAGHDTGIPLPFRLLEQLPFFKGNRYPSRYSVMLMLSVAPLVAAGAYGVLRIAYSVLTSRQIPAHGHAESRTTLHASTLHASRSPSFYSSLLLFEHLSAPLPISDLRVPAIYAQVAAEPGDFALLELPPGWRNGARVAGKQDVVIMSQLWNQTSHGKRVLGGNTSRNPEFKFQYFSEDPTLARLIALTNAADLPDQHGALREALAASPVTAEDRERARDLAAFLSLRYVMVHRDKLPRRPKRRCASCSRWNWSARRATWRSIGSPSRWRRRDLLSWAQTKVGWRWPKGGARRRPARGWRRMGAHRRFSPNGARPVCCCRWGARRARSGSTAGPSRPISR